MGAGPSLNPALVTANSSATATPLASPSFLVPPDSDGTDAGQPAAWRGRRAAYCLWSLAAALLAGQVAIWYYCGSYSIYEAETWGRWAFMWDWQPDVAAPVWVGEFGTSQDDSWWAHATSLFRTLDVGWAYWAIDGQRSSITSTDSYGLLEADYETVRSEWKVAALQRLMGGSALRL